MKNNVFSAPKRSLGQNFLADPNICRRIVEALNPEPEGPVLEIGPGRGALTRILAEHQGPVMALEKDRELAFWLRQEFPSINIILGDGLSFCWERTAALPGLSFVGNLPYNVASPMIWDLVSRCRTWKNMVFMVQKEVAERLTACPGSRAYGAFSAWVSNFSVPRYMFTVPPYVFRPQPKVDSAVVSFFPHPAPAWEEAKDLSRILKMLFQQRRKQLGSILKSVWTEKMDEWCGYWRVDRRVRPEALSPDMLRSLSRIVMPKA